MCKYADRRGSCTYCNNSKRPKRGFIFKSNACCEDGCEYKEIPRRPPAPPPMNRPRGGSAKGHDVIVEIVVRV